MIKEALQETQRAGREIIDDTELIGKAQEIIANGGIVSMQIDGPMYGFVFDVANPEIVSQVWQLKGRGWKETPVFIDEGISKPVTAVSRERFFNCVDWSKLPKLKNDNVLIKSLLDSGLHLVFPVNKDVPDHLITIHKSKGRQIRTLSMMIVDDFPLMGPIVLGLEENRPDIFTGGTSANKSGMPVFTKYEALREALGEEIDLIIKGKDIMYNEDFGRTAYQRGMVTALPEGIKIIREGIGLEQVKNFITNWNF